MKLAPGRVEALVWILIYGGLFVFALGFALSRGGLGYGWGVSVVGIVALWLRSRMREPGP